MEVGIHRSVTHAPFHRHHGKYGVTEIKMVSQPGGIPHAIYVRFDMFPADVVGSFLLDQALAGV